ncbi:flagellar protein FlaG [bacterium]|nr:flagellar protein FlaG [bacterium]
MNIDPTFRQPQGERAAATRRDPGALHKDREPVEGKTSGMEATEKPQKPEVKSTLDMDNRMITFERDDDLGRVVVKVVDPKTKEVIRELPPEELRDIAKRLQEAAGKLLDGMA